MYCFARCYNDTYIKDTGGYRCSKCNYRLNTLDHTHCKIDNKKENGDDGFFHYDFTRANGHEYFFKNNEKDKVCDLCYALSSKYRDDVAKEKFNNKIDDDDIKIIQKLIKSGKIMTMDKESMVPMNADSVMRYKDKLLIANSR